MADLLMQGLVISVLGMGLTFAALGLLILAMVILDRLFRPPEPVSVEVPVETAAERSEDEQVAAAIATALLYWRSQEQAGLGMTLETGPGAWWLAGRSERYGSTTQWRK